MSNTKAPMHLCDRGFYLCFELCHQIVVGLGVFALEIFHQAAAFADFLDETTAGRVVLFVGFQVIGKFFYLLGEDGDLNLRGAGVGGMRLIFFNNPLLLVWIQHSLSALSAPRDLFKSTSGRKGRIHVFASFADGT